MNLKAIVFRRLANSPFEPGLMITQGDTDLILDKKNKPVRKVWDFKDRPYYLSLDLNGTMENLTEDCKHLNHANGFREKEKPHGNSNEAKQIKQASEEGIAQGVKEAKIEFSNGSEIISREVDSSVSGKSIDAQPHGYGGN